MSSETTRKVITLTMVFAVVASMMVAGIGSVAADHNIDSDHTDLNDGDRIWVGQEVSLHDSNLTDDSDGVAELYAHDGDSSTFIKELSINSSTTPNFVVIDTMASDMSTGTYSVEANGTTVATFEISEQTLNMSAEKDSIANDESTALNVDSNRVSFDMYVSAENIDIDNLKAALNDTDGSVQYAESTDNGYTDGVSSDKATHIKVDSQGLMFNASGPSENIAAGDYTLDFDVADSNAAASADLSVHKAGEGNAEFDQSVYSVPEGDTTTFNVSVEERNDAVLIFGSSEAGYKAVVDIDTSSLDEGEMAEITFNSHLAGDNASAGAPFTSSNGAIAGVYETEAGASSNGLGSHFESGADYSDLGTTYPLDQHDYGMELTIDGESTDLATMSVGPHDEPVHSGTFITGDSPSSADFDSDDVTLHSGSTVAVDDHVVATFDNVGFTGHADAANPTNAGWNVIIEESEPGVNQDAQMLNSNNYELHWDQENRQMTVLVDTTASGAGGVDLADKDAYDIRLVLDAANNDYFDQADYEESKKDIDGDSTDEYVVYDASTSFEVDERVVEFDHEANDNGTFEFKKSTNGMITVEGSGTAAPGTEYTVVLRSDNADDPVIKSNDVELGENGMFSTMFDVSERSEGWEFTLDIRGPDSANDEPVDAVIASEEEPEPETYNLTVNVEDADGNALDDATVTVDGASDWGALENGTYTVSANAEGYQSASQDVTIDGDDATVTLTLEEEQPEPETFPVDVTVEDADGNAISDATVTVNGNSDWDEFEAGTTVTVEANADGYKSASKDVTVDGETSVTLTLEEESSEEPEEPEEPSEPNEQEGPGFGVAVAIVALLGAAMLALRRQN